MNTIASLPQGHAEVHAGLRAQARGSYHCEAVAELLIRACGGTLADPARPWICPGAPGSYRSGVGLDPDELNAAARRATYGRTPNTILDVAANLLEEAWDCTEALTTGGHLLDQITALDRAHLDLVLAAIAHAAGPFNAVSQPFQRGQVEVLPTLHPWPVQS